MLHNRLHNSIYPIAQKILKESLGVNWDNQLISVDIPVNTRKYHPDKLALVILENEEFQYISADLTIKDANTVTAEFFTGLQAYEEKIVCLIYDENCQKCCPFKVDYEENYIEVNNSIIAIRVPNSGRYSADNLLPPILSARYNNNDWLFRSTLLVNKKNTFTNITVEIIPNTVCCNIKILYRHEDNGSYTVLIKIDAHTGNIDITEEYSDFEARYFFDFSKTFLPDTSYARMHSPLEYKGSSDTWKRITYKVDYKSDATDIVKLQPFYTWDKNCSNAISFSSELCPCAVAFIPVQPSMWANGKANLLEIIATEKNSDKEFMLLAPLNTGKRKWVFSILNKNDFYSAADFVVTNEYQNFGYLLNKPIMHVAYVDRISAIYNGPSLGRYLSWATQWDEMDKISHPSLIIDKESASYVSEWVKKWEWLNNVINTHKDDNEGYDPAGVYLATGDISYAQDCKEKIRLWLQDRIWMLKNMGYTFHENVCIRLSRPLRLIAIDYDLIADSQCFTESDRKWFDTTFAFLMNCMNDSDYWPDASIGFSKGNVNFHSDYFSTLGVLACLLNNNPISKDIVAFVEREIDKELQKCVYEGGAWIEAPNYQAYSMNYYSVLFASLKNNGYKDYYTDERFLSTMDFLANLQTPVDPRSKICHIPTIGDTALNYWSQSFQNVFAWAASMTKATNPDFSKRMMTAWKNSGSMVINVGGECNSIFKFALAFLNPNLPCYSPDEIEWKSISYKGFGAIMKSPAENKTERGYLLFKAGEICQHYDHDEGSIIWYAKGAPLLTDIGSQYSPGCDATFLHNRISIDHKTDQCRGKLKFFKSAANTDFAISETLIDRVQPWSEWPKRDPNWNFRYEPPAYDILPNYWTRSIIYLKDTQELIVRDDVLGNDPSELNILSYASEISKKDDGCYFFKGQFGVDMNVYIYAPGAVEYQTHYWGYAGLDEPIFYTAFEMDWKKYKWVWENEITAMPENVGILRVFGKKNSSYVTFYQPQKPGESTNAVRYEMDGRVMIREHNNKKVIVILSDKKICYHTEDIYFVGEMAVIRIDGKEVHAELCEGEYFKYLG